MIYRVIYENRYFVKLDQQTIEFFDGTVLEAVPITDCDCKKKH